MPRSKSRPLDALGVAGTIACCALWGGNAVAVKFSVPDLPPLVCAGLRFVIGIPFIALVCLRSRQPLWVRPSHLGLAGVHAILTVVQIGSFNWGTNLSLAGRASVLINIHPLVVAPLAALYLHEHLGGRGRLGLISAALGVGLLLGSSYFGQGGLVGTGLLGDLAVVASGVIFGIQTIIQKKTFPLIPPTTLLLTQSILALPLFLVLSLVFEGVGSYRFRAHSVWGLVYQGVAALGVCYTLWFWLLRHYPVGHLATLAFLTPLFGIGFSRVFQGELLSWPLVCAAAGVGLGIYLVASDRSAAAPAAFSGRGEVGLRPGRALPP
jgi:drug/metabolite transporter (DMT)-like permease